LHNKGEPKHYDQEAMKRTIMNLMMLGYKEDENWRSQVLPRGK
jgi:hypothetical protein